MGLNLYKIKDIDNFAIIDSPGNDEIGGALKLFASKGCLYSKIFIYLIKENDEFTSKIKDNKILKELIKLRNKFKIQLLVLLTYFDSYCENVKKNHKDNWKEICKEKIDNNKKILWEYLDSEIKKDNSNNFPMQENDIMHICLVESSNIIQVEDILKTFDEETLEQYNNGNEKIKKALIKSFISGNDMKNQNDIKIFLENDLKVLGQKELIREIKRRLPSQYHNAFKSLK